MTGLAKDYGIGIEGIVSMKQCYCITVRSLADEDDNIITLCKRVDGIGCYILCISGMVFCECINAVTG
jgi:hypothetical protein